MRIVSFLGLATLSLMLMGMKKNVEPYSKALEATLALIEKKEAKPLIEKEARKLVELSKPLLADFLKQYPVCKDYLNKALAAADQMPLLSITNIEKDFHLDGALPKAPDDCYHAKDLLVHPATVLVLLKSSLKDAELYDKMKGELAELRAHLKLVDEKLK